MVRLPDYSFGLGLMNLGLGLVVLSSVEHKRCKGVRKNVVKKHITHDDYKNCLLNREEQMRKMNVIRSHFHDLYTEEINKVALSAEDDKRVIIEDGIHTLAYGHYSLIN